MSGSRLPNRFSAEFRTDWSSMAPKRYFLLAAVSSILLTLCGILALWVALCRPNGAIAAIIGQAALFGVAPFIAIFAALALKRKSLRPSNYPRIEHLRIAGKYQALRRFPADMGVSPLHLKG